MYTTTTTVIPTARSIPRASLIHIYTNMRRCVIPMLIFQTCTMLIGISDGDGSPD